MCLIFWDTTNASILIKINIVFIILEIYFMSIPYQSHPYPHLLPEGNYCSDYFKIGLGLPDLGLHINWIHKIVYYLCKTFFQLTIVFLRFMHVFAYHIGLFPKVVVLFYTPTSIWFFSYFPPVFHVFFWYSYIFWEWGLNGILIHPEWLDVCSVVSV